MIGEFLVSLLGSKAWAMLFCILFVYILITFGYRSYFNKSSAIEAGMFAFRDFLLWMMIVITLGAGIIGDDDSLFKQSGVLFIISVICLIGPAFILTILYDIKVFLHYRNYVNDNHVVFYADSILGPIFTLYLTGIGMSTYWLLGMFYALTANKEGRFLYGVLPLIFFILMLLFAACIRSIMFRSIAFIFRKTGLIEKAVIKNRYNHPEVIGEEVYRV